MTNTTLSESFETRSRGRGRGRGSTRGTSEDMSETLRGGEVGGSLVTIREALQVGQRRAVGTIAPPRRVCPGCRKEYSAKYLPTHRRNSCPGRPVEEEHVLESDEDDDGEDDCGDVEVSVVMAEVEDLEATMIRTDRRRSVRRLNERPSLRNRNQRNVEQEVEAVLNERPNLRNCNQRNVEQEVEAVLSSPPQPSRPQRPEDDEHYTRLASTLERRNSTDGTGKNWFSIHKSKTFLRVKQCI